MVLLVELKLNLQKHFIHMYPLMHKLEKDNGGVAHHESKLHLLGVQ